ncbi:uncharacterized protein LOC120276470 [Dioscorea cayenensis subsp. rotundata]|uniref:Uncharacterized protein LOC120276470 n=1 Tax=Dioscorea cayennensis subsp. rotundata TaxID=55577 RepID=A0AB40CK72_DIOCR|nr:uncharacterized protein LOC120276470 [Dioscorea cayenensis subsp. rotundata]
MQLNQSKRSRISKLSDTLELKQDELPVCPKPRRPSEFVYPLNYMQSNSSHQQVSSEILEMIGIKSDELHECSSNGCPPSCYCGSPPTRVDNPHVHDVHFLQQAKLLQQYAQPLLPKRLDF